MYFECGARFIYLTQTEVHVQRESDAKTCRPAKVHCLDALILNEGHVTLTR
jgi:hypothetical protein